MSNVSNLPESQITFDLDAEERDDAKEPFVANVKGRAITMQDPEDLDWQDLLDVGENPINFLRFAVSEDDRNYIFGLKMPGWKLGRLMQNYMRYYGVDEKVRQFEREQRRGF